MIGALVDDYTPKLVRERQVLYRLSSVQGNNPKKWTID
jgi:hypothetical protein